ncbi:sigma-70 family RNA polymerase sigma factor [Puniceicoccaceae bacterium K14]|nr:sigma-70 family RNA polymerase sigma factor [Puniceicoccaceae bacterium K14]
MGVRELTLGMCQLDDSAYREFFNAYYDRLGSYLVAMSGGDFNKVEDALQMTLVRVPKCIRIFDTEEVFWSWLTRLARSAYIDCYRKDSVFSRLKRRFSQMASEEIDQVRSPDGEDQSMQIEEAMMLLDKTDQTLLKLKYFSGLSVRQIAEKFERTEKAVESGLSRARSKLRKQLAKKGKLR